MSLTAIVVWHAVLALAAGLGGRRLGRNVLLVAALGPVATLVWLAARTGDVLHGGAVVESAPWVPGLGLGLDMRLDGLGLLFWWLIAGIGLLVMLYALRYFGRRDDLGRFTAMLVLFAGSMLLLTAADNVFLLFVGWELTSITSYLLIGFDDRQATARASALQALLVTGLGGLALLGGLVLLGQASGTTSLAGILASHPDGGIAQAGLVLLLLGAATKSAQTPFHFWLPGAMAAPTPVSAYLHSATMVKAGIYLLARVAPAFGPVVDWWGPAVVVLGSLSMIVGGWRALTATDLKALLAYGTVSQLGFIVLLVGYGDPDLTHAGIALLLAHALFKATLFLTAGVVDHQAHTRDLRRLSGLWPRMPRTGVAAVVAAASMAGIIPLFGFISKEAALEASTHVRVGGPSMTVVIVVGSLFTMAYGLRYLWGAFATKRDDELIDGGVALDDVARPPLAFEVPALVLTVLTVLFGLWVAPADALVSSAAGAVSPEAGEIHLALWHGVGTPLLLSLLAIGGGYLLYRLPGVVTAVGRVSGRVPDTEHGYRRLLPGLLTFADRVTAIVQPGSLPLYAAVILATVLLLPDTAMLATFNLPDDLVLAESALQVAVGAMVVGAAIGAAWVRRRLAAVLLLGAVGYGVAVLFVIQGAPDLALTQMLVETLSLAVFVLVLRRLPDDFGHHPWRFGQWLRGGLSLAVGGLVGAFALTASSARSDGTAAAEFLARAKPEGGGANVVNVILTDFRALDTFGEITVLVLAAIGISLLVRTPTGDREDEEERS
jgi:multicomponent Na+:H+ antiporter subunit A